MSRRQIALFTILGFAFGAFVISAAIDRHSALADVLSLATFGIVFVAFACVLLATSGRKPGVGRRGIPRFFLVVFASFAVAFASAMLSGVLAMPWVGFRGFEILLGSEDWWVLPLFAIVAFPFVRKYLL